WGIYFDEGSSFILAEGNVVYRTQDAGLHQHCSVDNRVRHNVFALGTNGQIRISNLERTGVFTVEENLFYCEPGPVFEMDWIDDEIVFRGNLYTRSSGAAGLRFAGGLTPAQWKSREPGAVLADLRFADASSGDFRPASGGFPAEMQFSIPAASAAGRRTNGRRTAGLPPVARVFPQAPDEEDLVNRLSVDEDFEALEPGSTMPEFVSMIGPGESANVVAGSAAGGGKCLRFREGTHEGSSFMPHVYAQLSYRGGVVRNSFDLRVEPGARLSWEWRDWPGGKPYRTGPSIHVAADGKVSTQGGELLSIPPGQWVHVGLECPMGAASNRAWSADFTLPGQPPRRFDRLPVQDGFGEVTWVGFSSLGGTGAVFYVDNFKLNRMDH
ncbi:MAG: right-handed parallel beta-helix repeat-containing protein, partial [Lentisphaerae bacterium]|nr:right-handed parallel beta-helix repeat-containing protein [Lentisphaerota bacterium]